MDTVSTDLRRLWEVYFAFTIFLTVGRAYSLFTPESPEHLYFTALNAFEHGFSLFYILALLQIAFTAFHWLPLALHIFRRRLGPPLFWQVMLVSRAILDVAGNSYAKNLLVSLYRNDPWICALTLLYLGLPYVPWYWACGRYAFGGNRLFPPSHQSSAVSRQF